MASTMSSKVSRHHRLISKTYVGRDGLNGKESGTDGKLARQPAGDTEKIS